MMFRMEGSHPFMWYEYGDFDPITLLPNLRTELKRSFVRSCLTSGEHKYLDSVGVQGVTQAPDFL